MVDVVDDLKRIKLQEFGEAVLCPADSINLGALTQTNTRWRQLLGLRTDPIRVVDSNEKFVRLRAEMVTGVVRVDDVDIEIAPKFLNVQQDGWQGVLWQILTAVEGGYVDETLTSAHEWASLSIPDLLAEIFLASYSKGAARGLPRGYKTKQAQGVELRGSLDLSRLGQWIIEPWKIPYVSDQLSEDVPIARLLRWSAETLSNTVRYSGRARALREIAASLSLVGRRPPHLLDARRITLDTQHQGLVPAKLVGLLLLEGSGVIHSLGEQLLSGFLWKSDVIYENYIFWLCQRAANHRFQHAEKRVTYFGKVVSGDGRKLETTPDVVFRDASDVITAITDSKYKILGSRPKAADTYQILTAAHVLGCRHVSLTYPVSLPREATVWQVTSALGEGIIELTALPMNLMSLLEPGGTQRLVDIILGWLDHVDKSLPPNGLDYKLPNTPTELGDDVSQQELFVDRG